MARSLQVFPHPGFEALAGAFLREASSRPRQPVPHPVVVPSVAFSDRLQAWIARRAGVCMGLDFITPRTLVQRAVGGEDSPWTKARLVWHVFPRAAAVARRFGVAEPTPRDAFAFAGLIADRLDQYGHCRPELLRTWAGGRDATGDPEEGWQRDLWADVAASLPDDPHPALELAHKARDPVFLDGLRERLGSVTVIVAGSFDPLLAEVLGMLGKAGGEVRVHALLPSLGFLADLRKRGAIPAEGEDPETFALESGNPLLASMARQAAGVFALLGRLDEHYAHWPEPSAEKPDDVSLLRRIQSDIRAQRAPEPGCRADGSLRVHACFGPLREVEALKDELYRAFAELPGLRHEDVLIAAPETENYAPLVAAVFGDGAIRVRPMERPRSERPAGEEALAALLAMAAGGRYRASEVLALLGLRAVQTLLGIGEDPGAVERARGWVVRSGLTRGIEGDEPGRWRFARDRLIAGRWFGDEGSATYRPWEFALPVADPLGGDDDALPAFLAWHAALEAAMRAWAVAATAEEWAGRLRWACAVLLDPGEEGLADLHAHLGALAETGCPEPLDAGAVMDWFDSATSEGGMRAPFSGAVAFGRLTQLQNLPCRVLALLGMGDAAFPGRNTDPSWDLLRRMPRPWDRNARTDDRQRFLDAILAPADRLIITAPTRNVRTGKKEPFASPVDELLRVAEAMGAARSGLLAEHRLQPFSEDYFSGGGALPRSFDAGAAAIAQALRAEPTPARFYIGGTAGPTSHPITVEAADLARFWRDPATAFLKARGIAIAGEERDDAAFDAAPLALDKLGEWGLKADVAGAIIAGDTALDLMKARRFADRALPPREIGTRVWEHHRRTAESLAAAYAAIFAGHETVEVPSAGCRVTANFDRSRSGAILAWRAGKAEKPKHFLPAWIIALVAAASGDESGTLFLSEEHHSPPLALLAVPPETASATLAHLVEGYFAAGDRPVCFAPATSERWAAKGAEAAREMWGEASDFDHDAGEGLAPAAALAWRDADPFERAEEWERWVEIIARPLLDWRKGR